MKEKIRKMATIAEGTGFLYGGVVLCILGVVHIMAGWNGQYVETSVSVSDYRKDER